MMPSIHRRDFLGSLTGASLMALAGCRPPKTEYPEGDYTWTGIGFGIEMSMELFGVSQATGEELGRACEGEIKRLENAFSLYLENSELSRLNRDKVLDLPSAVFLELLQLSLRLAKRTDGYYQPAIHGAWQWLVEQEGLSGLDNDAVWVRRLDSMDLVNVEVLREKVRLKNPSTALSMNAIGQGFLVDRVAALVRAQRVESALLHLGETVAIGAHPSGRPWRLAVAGSAADELNADLASVELVDSGLAVSSVGGDRWLIDPVARLVRQQNRTVAVVTREGAAVADAFATAFGVAPESAWERLYDSLREDGHCQVHLWEMGELRFQRSTDENS